MLSSTVFRYAKPQVADLQVLLSRTVVTVYERQFNTSVEMEPKNRALFDVLDSTGKVLDRYEGFDPQYWFENGRLVVKTPGQYTLRTFDDSDVDRLEYNKFQVHDRLESAVGGAFTTKVPFWPQILSQPVNGVARLSSDGKSIAYSSRGFVGMESFSYRMINAFGQVSEPACITLSVANIPPGSPPVFSDEGDGFGRPEVGPTLTTPVFHPYYRSPRRTETAVHKWIVPEGVYLLSVLRVGGGAPQPTGTFDESGVSGTTGKGADVAYRNDIPVVPGTELTIMLPGQLSTALPEVYGLGDKGEPEVTFVGQPPEPYFIPWSKATPDPRYNQLSIYGPYSKSATVIGDWSARTDNYHGLGYTGDPAGSVYAAAGGRFAFYRNTISDYVNMIPGENGESFVYISFGKVSTGAIGKFPLEDLGQWQKSFKHYYPDGESAELYTYVYKSVSGHVSGKVPPTPVPEPVPVPVPAPDPIPGTDPVPPKPVPVPVARVRTCSNWTMQNASTSCGSTESYWRTCYANWPQPNGSTGIAALPRDGQYLRGEVMSLVMCGGLAPGKDYKLELTAPAGVGASAFVNCGAVAHVQFEGPRTITVTVRPEDGEGSLRVRFLATVDKIPIWVAVRVFDAETGELLYQTGQGKVSSQIKDSSQHPNGSSYMTEMNWMSNDAQQHYS